MLTFIQIFLSTILALVALGVACLLLMPVLVMFWPLLLLALPIAIIVYTIQLIEKAKLKNNKPKRSKK